MRIGQKVTQTANFKWGTIFDEIVPQFGVVYTIRAINIYQGEGFLWFYEIKNPPCRYSDNYYEMDFCARWFRPVVERETDISALKALLNPVRRGDTPHPRPVAVPASIATVHTLLVEATERP